MLQRATEKGRARRGGGSEGFELNGATELKKTALRPETATPQTKQPDLSKTAFGAADEPRGGELRAGIGEIMAQHLTEPQLG